MKIVIISIQDMGHMIPMLHIAEELSSRGHDVTVLSNEYAKDQCEKMITSKGCTPLFTRDGLDKEILAPKIGP